MSETFINPYSFVPLGEPPRRAEPPGHEGRVAGGPHGPLVSGIIEVTWTLRTPLLLPETAEREGWIAEDGAIAIPGSSLKGAVRSLHEAMFNGCLRVVDESFVPSYREPANPSPDTEWRLALVLGEGEGGQVQVQLCGDDLTFVDAASLKGRWPNKGLPRTGDVVQLAARIEEGALGRDEIQNIERVVLVRQASDQPGRQIPPQTAGDWVFIVTDTAARQPHKKNRSPGRCLWAASRLTDTTASVTPEALQRFWHAVVGSEDRRILEREDRRRVGPQDKHPDRQWRQRRSLDMVSWQGRPVGMRARHTGFLFPHDVIWVQCADGVVTDLKLSQLWRRSGRGPVGGRLSGAHPCLTRPEEDGQLLCPSCATFGAADTRGSDAGQGQQVAYAGHVRFGSAKSTGPVQLKHIDLAPMSAPRPGNGMFYLDLPDTLPAGREEGDTPTRWGSSVDAEATATIRGRKFYWHSDPDRQASHWRQQTGRSVRPRYEATPEQRRGHMTRSATLVAAGTPLTATIAVDGLPRRHALALILALDPSRLARHVGREADSVAVRLGGGKPLGLGAASVQVTPHLTMTKERYAGHDSELDWPVQVGRSELGDLEALAGGGMWVAIPSLLRLLDLTGLEGHDHLVSYPPGADWKAFGEQQFRESFKFFTFADGALRVTGANAWHPLPSPEPGRPQTLPVIWRKTR